MVFSRKHHISDNLEISLTLRGSSVGRARDRKSMRQWFDSIPLNKNKNKIWQQLQKNLDNLEH